MAGNKAHGPLNHLSSVINKGIVANSNNKCLEKLLVKLSLMQIFFMPFSLLNPDNIIRVFISCWECGVAVFYPRCHMT